MVRLGELIGRKPTEADQQREQTRWLFAEIVDLAPKGIA